MTDQPGYYLEEAAKLFDVLRRRMRTSGGSATDDVWSQAIRDHGGIATGAPECRYCPICRTIAAARTSGQEVMDHMVDAGQALYAAFRETMAAYERTRPPRREADGDRADFG